MKFDPSAVQRYREQRELSRMELATRAGVHLNTIGSLERGEMEDPKASTIAAIAAALGVSPEDFFVENGAAA